MNPSGEKVRYFGTKPDGGDAHLVLWYSFCAVSIWVPVTSLVQLTVLTQTSPPIYYYWNHCNANMAFELQRKKHHIRCFCFFFFGCCCYFVSLGFFYVIQMHMQREPKPCNFWWNTVLCFLSGGILSQTCSARFLLIILLTALSFHDLFYIRCAWKMTPSLHQPHPGASFILPHQQLDSSAHVSCQQLSYQSCHRPI